MEPLYFLFAGVPAAFLLDRVLRRLLASYAAEDGAAGEHGTAAALEVGRLPWQAGPWRDRLRLLVVAMTPPLMAACAMRFEAVEAAAVSALVLALLLCTATDLLEYRVPNAVTYPGSALALVAALAFPNGDALNAALSAFGAGLVYLVLSIITRGGLGLGDVKLAVLIGAALGFPGSYQALALGVVAGGIVIGLLFAGRVVSRKQAVPYAPFLALAAVAVLLARGAAFTPL